MHNNSQKLCCIAGSMLDINSDSFNCAVIGGINNDIDNDNDSCVIIGGHGNDISNNRSNSIVMGSNNNCINSGCFMFSDGAGGTALTSVSNHTFLAQCSNGATFFTNTANTTGPSLAPGGAGWAPPCNCNKKENIIKLDYQDFMD